MGACGYQYQESHPPCPHATVDGSDRCLWHDARTRKDDAYVPILLQAADRQTDGGLDAFQLVGLHWPAAQLTGRSLRKADLRDAFLDNADLSGADLAGSTLRRTSLKRANLQRACLTGADLSSCNLSGADLREADLTHAILARTVLNGADLRGANLAGAHIDGFLWNAATRFQGVHGVAEPLAAGEDDETRACLSPMVAGALAEFEEGERSQLDDLDPDREATRSFAALAPVVGAARARPGNRRAERTYLAIACVSLLVAAVGVAVGLTPQSNKIVTSSGIDPQLALEQERQQSAAYRDRLQTLEHEQATLAGTRDESARAIEAAKGESQRLTTLLRQAQSDAARLREADDRIALADQRIAAIIVERDTVQEALLRQQRLGAILAAGTQRLQEQTTTQEKRVAELTQAAERAALIARELATARAESKRDAAARDDAVARSRQLSDELATTRDDLERYLGRVTGTAWQDLLTDNGAQSPFVAIEPGHTIALGGAYALTVRISSSHKPGMIATALTVQRPLGAPDPDVAVLLYDREHRILRRMAFSFPALDDREPLAAAQADIACAQFPAYVRILVAPTVATAAR